MIMLLLVSALELRCPAEVLFLVVVYGEKIIGAVPRERHRSKWGKCQPLSETRMSMKMWIIDLDRARGGVYMPGQPPYSPKPRHTIGFQFGLWVGNGFLGH
jgi:hypothetical protein